MISEVARESELFGERAGHALMDRERVKEHRIADAEVFGDPFGALEALGIDARAAEATPLLTRLVVALRDWRPA